MNTDEKKPAEVCHYIRGRLAAIDADLHALKTQRADRRHQLALNIETELHRVRWALGYMPDDCNYGKQGTNAIMPQLGEFARRIMDDWPEGGMLDGGDLQDIGEATGVLVPRTMDKPCGENCQCSEFYGSDEWPVTCYRLNLDGSVIDPRALKEHGGEA